MNPRHPGRISLLRWSCACALGALLPPGAALADKVAFQNVGSYTWTVPAGATWLRVTAIGGGGGAGNEARGGGWGGPGGKVAKSSWPVTAGQTVNIVVGGGGDGAGSGWGAGAGGGASSLNVGASWIIAGGGGGGGGYHGGAGGRGCDGLGGIGNPGVGGTYAGGPGAHGSNGYGSPGGAGGDGAFLVAAGVAGSVGGNGNGGEGGWGPNGGGYFSAPGYGVGSGGGGWGGWYFDLLARVSGGGGGGGGGYGGGGGGGSGNTGDGGGGGGGCTPEGTWNSPPATNGGQWGDRGGSGSVWIEWGYELGGSISGLNSDGLVLAAGSTPEQTVAAGSSSFAFPELLSFGSPSYNVTVQTQPTGQTCTVANGSGTATADVSNVAVTCATNTYAIGGAVSGLASGQSVVLQNNGGNNAAVNANGSFTFSTPINYGASYAVTVLTQPAGQTCTVANGNGIATANVSNVVVTCASNTYTIGGTVSGLDNAYGWSAVLQNNGGDDLTMYYDDVFTFATPIAYGASYAVTVATQPTGLSCTVSNGNGTVTGNVTNVAVTCGNSTYAIATAAIPPAGGTVNCTPNPVTYGSNASCTQTPNAGYTFTGWSGACSGTGACSLGNVTSAQGVTANYTQNSYTISATASPPAGGTASCTPNPVGHGATAICTATPNAGYSFANWSGDCTGASCTLSNVTAAKSVTANFNLNTYTIGGAVSGLAGGQSVVLQNNGGNNLTVNANGGFTFSTPIAYGASYAVSVLTRPTGQTCSVASGSGTATANVTNVSVTCSAITYAIATAANPPAGGTVSCTPNPVSHGGSSSCTAAPNAGYSFANWSGDCTGASCTLSNVTAAKSVTAHFTLLGTKTYSGPSATGSGSITASFTGGGAACGYSTARFVAVSAVPTPLPAGVSFPHGLFDFTTGGCTPGSMLSFTITYPQALPPNTRYWKYGPTPDNVTPHWYALPAGISGNTVTFDITDGGLGDDDLAANGTIVDQGGPGVGNLDIPTLSDWALLVLALLLGAIGVRRTRVR